MLMNDRPAKEKKPPQFFVKDKPLTQEFKRQLGLQDFFIKMASFNPAQEGHKMETKMEDYRGHMNNLKIMSDYTPKASLPFSKIREGLYNNEKKNQKEPSKTVKIAKSMKARGA